MSYVLLGELMLSPWLYPSPKDSLEFYTQPNLGNFFLFAGPILNLKEYNSGALKLVCN